MNEIEISKRLPFISLSYSTTSMPCSNWKIIWNLTATDTYFSTVTKQNKGCFFLAGIEVK